MAVESIRGVEDPSADPSAGHTLIVVFGILKDGAELTYGWRGRLCPGAQRVQGVGAAPVGPCTSPVIQVLVGPSFFTPIGKDWRLRLVPRLLFKQLPGLREFSSGGSNPLCRRGVLEFYHRPVGLVDEVGGLDKLLWRGVFGASLGPQRLVFYAHLHEHVFDAANVATILSAPRLLDALKVFGLGVPIDLGLVKGLLERLELGTVGIAVGGGTPEAGPLPRGLRLQHDDVFGFRGDVSIAVASLECGSDESTLTYSRTDLI